MSPGNTMEAGDLLAYGRRVLAQQPFSRMLGASLESWSEGSAELALPLAPELLQQDGFVHGGVLAYLADNALTYAGGSVLGPVLTSEMKINYLRPARDGERLVAVATVVGSGRSQAVCRCDVFVESGGQRRLCAAAQGTIRKVEARA